MKLAFEPLPPPVATGGASQDPAAAAPGEAVGSGFDQLLALFAGAAPVEPELPELPDAPEAAAEPVPDEAAALLLAGLATPPRAAERGAVALAAAGLRPEAAPGSPAEPYVPLDPRAQAIAPGSPETAPAGSAGTAPARSAQAVPVASLAPPGPPTGDASLSSPAQGDRRSAEPATARGAGAPEGRLVADLIPPRPPVPEPEGPTVPLASAAAQRAPRPESQPAALSVDRHPDAAVALATTRLAAEASKAQRPPASLEAGPPEGGPALELTAPNLPPEGLARAGQRGDAPPVLPSQPALAARVTWLAEQGGGTARLQLHPRELGEVEVSVRVRGNRVDVQFLADDPNAQLAVTAARERLVEALGSRDLRMEGFEVRSGGEPGVERDAGRSQPDGGRRDEPGFGAERHPERTRAWRSAAEPTALASLRTRFTTRTGGVDLRV